MLVEEGGRGGRGMAVKPGEVRSVELASLSIDVI